MNNSRENNKQDRISKYLSRHLGTMMFGELSPSWLEKTGAAEILTGVPVPLGGNETSVAGETGVKTIVLNMARVIGGDPFFVYAERYEEFIKLAAGGDSEAAARMLIAEGARSADEGDLYDACMLLRAALRIDPKSRDALYLYARACRECYETESSAAADSMGGMGDEEMIGMFKAEAMESFELLTMIHPDFTMGYYFLGYAYLNMGLYLKAKLTWQEFIKRSSGNAAERTSAVEDAALESNKATALDSGEDAVSDSNKNGDCCSDKVMTEGTDADMIASLRTEISERLEELTEPVEIENGCNMIMRGDYQGGKAVLDKFRDGRYSEWWPLWYYLGAAESALGRVEEAAACYKRVLRLSPSNTDAMEELAAIYAMTGDEEKAAKYRNKIEIIHRNLAEEGKA